VPYAISRFATAAQLEVPAITSVNEFENPSFPADSSNRTRTDAVDSGESLPGWDFHPPRNPSGGRFTSSERRQDCAGTGLHGSGALHLMGTVRGWPIHSAPPRHRRII